jgi:hypothetical protein
MLKGSTSVSLAARLTGRLLMLLVCLHVVPTAAQQPKEFDHFLTGFPLTGAHNLIDCSACHRGGVFKGTPLQCARCHNGVRAQGKTPRHVATTADCDDCHTTTNFTNARFDHWAITGPCTACHNNTTAVGKSASHIRSSEDCEACHSTTITWRVSRVDHSHVIGACTSCHNGSTASGKPGNHILTTQQCGICHNTNTWAGARFDHTGAVGTCQSCHNGTTAAGQPADHIPTGGASCNNCHTTEAWLPAQ